MVVKEEHSEEAERAFANTNVNITTQGKRNLDAVVDSLDFRDEFVEKKVKIWWNEIELLSKVAQSHPHAAFAAYVHGQATKWTYISQTTPDISHLLEPLEQLIRENSYQPLLDVHLSLKLNAPLRHFHQEWVHWG